MNFLLIYKLNLRPFAITDVFSVLKQNYQEQVFHLKDVRFKFGHHEWASDLLSFVQWEHRHGKQIKQWSVHKKYDYLTLLNHE